MKWGWILKGFQVVGIITGKLPQIIEDGKITVDEAMELLTAILAVFDVPTTFDIPDEIKGAVISAGIDL